VPIVHQCSHPDCETLTMGEFCVEHEPNERLTGVLRNLDDALEAAIDALHGAPSARASS
jgi:hypothetical protein